MCGSSQNPCSWQFRITDRYAGDNYKVYFAFDQTAKRFAATSDLYTAWKHLHVERERMCAKGKSGLLFQSYGAVHQPGECGGDGQPPCCGTPGQPDCCGPDPPATPCDQILLFDWADNISDGDEIVVFDEREGNTFEEITDTRLVDGDPTSNGNGSITVTLKMPWPNSVFAADRGPVTGPIFTNGHSGGACVPTGGFVEADTSGMMGTFGNGLIDFHVPVYGLEGSGTVPFYSPIDFGTSQWRKCEPHRFSQIWFQEDQAAGTPIACGDGTFYAAIEPNNYIHVIGASRGPSATLGYTSSAVTTSYVYIDNIVDCCNGELGCSPPTGGCDTMEQENYIREVTSHEVGHLFDVNACVAAIPPNIAHDLREAWCGGDGGTGTCLNPIYMTQECIMNSLTETKGADMLADGIDHFCSDDLATGDPHPTCNEMPLKGAMRATEDPL